MEEITIIDVPTIKVMGMRKKGHYKLIAELLQKLYPYLVSKEAHFNGPPIFVCHETAEEAMEADKNGTADVEVCAPVESFIEETDEIKAYKLPGGKMAKTIHKGPYEDCGPTYENLFKLITEKGYKINGPTREAYLNDPREVEPEEILTEIYAPIE